MKRTRAAAWILAASILILMPLGIRAQTPPTSPPPGGTPGAEAQSGTQTQAQPAQTGGQTEAAQPVSSPGTAPTTSAPSPPQPASPMRASWTSDRARLRVGDIFTVVIDEQTTAREFFSRTASADRSTDANLKADADGKSAIGATGLAADMGGKSRDIGEANREGDLIATVGVRVISIDEAGNARIEGSKKVVVDGREQQITLQGIVRPQDVPPSNVIHSSRIADASFGYKGMKIGPRRSFIGRILSMLWP
jgi:flagellar L-ring protein precursor FlgH